MVYNFLYNQPLLWVACRVRLQYCLYFLKTAVHDWLMILGISEKLFSMKMLSLFTIKKTLSSLHLVAVRQYPKRYWREIKCGFICKVGGSQKIKKRCLTIDTYLHEKLSNYIIFYHWLTLLVYCKNVTK